MAEPRGIYRYAIRLKRSVRKDRRFIAQNPDYDGRGACYYIGTSARDPETRFQQHKAGYKAARIAKKFGVAIEQEHCKRLSTSDSKSARKKEAAYARYLRSKGLGVYQN